ncbi:hypothetical protein KBD45_02710 [Candidatus Dojkabacteria bacterium]|nr:hypothetical protein [Candidatus Dojkabacteria bacterium]
MAFLWKILIILAILLSAAYGVWDIYLAKTTATVELEKYVVDKIEATLFIPVFNHLAEKEGTIYTKSEKIGAVD